MPLCKLSMHCLTLKPNFGNTNPARELHDRIESCKNLIRFVVDVWRQGLTRLYMFTRIGKIQFTESYFYASGFIFDFFAQNKLIIKRIGNNLI